jgi:predicted transcriptional regulator
MEQNTGKATATLFRKLLANCGSTVFQACKKSGVTPSTFYRWESGSEPSAVTVGKMRGAIMSISTEGNKTLPGDLVAELDRLMSTLKADDQSKKLDVASRLDRLEKVVTEQLGGTL